MNIHKKNNALIRKKAVHPEFHKQLFDYFNLVPVQDPTFLLYLKEKSIGYFSCGYHKLLERGKVMRVCWFINKGAIVVLYEDTKNRTSTLKIFVTGELAILDISFNTGVPSSGTFIICPDTHILEISRIHMDLMHEIYPATRELIRQLLTKQDKTEELANFPKLESKERIILLRKLYPDLLGRNAKIKIQYQFIASYISISKYAFSRFIKEIEEEEKLLKK